MTGVRALDKDAWTKIQSEWMDRTRSLLDQLSDDYPAAATKAAELTLALRTAIADTLQSRLNSHIATMPNDSVEEKSALATWVNHELHELGLAIRCPSTGGTAILCVDARDEDDRRGRFRLSVRGHANRHKTLTSANLFDLELMPDNPRREGADKLSRRGHPQKPGSGRA
jgi:hypothetical protein